LPFVATLRSISGGPCPTACPDIRSLILIASSNSEEMRGTVAPLSTLSFFVLWRRRRLAVGAAA
jgi:hypothetical protein